MVIDMHLFADLSDEALTDAVKRLARDERQATAHLVASLAEFDARRLYLGAGSSSLFAFCTRVLRLSEHAAYHRIEAARAARRFPTILERLADGSLTLTNATLLAPHLTPENHVAVLDAARHKSKREVERQAAALAPRPDVPLSVRKQPQRRSPAPAAPCAASADDVARETTAAANLVAAPADDPASAARTAGTCGDAAPVATVTQAPARRQPAIIEPLSPARYKLQMTVGTDTVDKLRRAQDLMRHAVPDGDLAVIVDRALALLLRDLERTKLGAARRPQPARPPSKRSRHVPAEVRRAVWARDEGRCTFVGAEGRCGETGFLELHHLEPYALGGATTLNGMALRCRAHNRYEAEQEFSVPSGEPATGSRTTASTPRRDGTCPLHGLPPV